MNDFSGDAMGMESVARGSREGHGAPRVNIVVGSSSSAQSSSPSTTASISAEASIPSFPSSIFVLVSLVSSRSADTCIGKSIGLGGSSGWWEPVDPDALPALPGELPKNRSGEPKPPNGSVSAVSGPGPR